MEPHVFTSLVRERFLNQPGKFKKYSNLLVNISSRRQDDPSDAISDLKNMFADDQDLLINLNNFLPKRYQIITNKLVPLIDLHKDYEYQLEAQVDFINNVHNRLSKIDNGRRFVEFCDIMNMFQNKELTVHEVDGLLSDLFQNDTDLYVEFTRLTADEYEKTQQDLGETYNFTSANKKKRERTDHEKKLEKKLVIWENYKYESDMFYHRIESTLLKLDRVVEQLKQVERDCVNVEEFKNQDFECIELLYGESDGEYMVELLLTDPSVNAKIMQARIAKKLEELREWRGQMDMVWGEILEDARRGKEPTRYSGFFDKVKKRFG